ncbi:MAG: HAD family hydrolase [Actinomycetota bacterium]
MTGQRTTELPTIDAVVLDFDGTILDTEWSEYVTVRDEFRRHGIDYPLDRHREGVGRGDNRDWLDVLAEAAGPLPDPDEIRSRRRQAHRTLIESSDLRPGVAELLDRSARCGLPLAVASSSPASWVTGHLTRLGLLDRFGTIATGDRVEQAKPWPDVFLLAASELGLEPDRCLAVEDSHNGVTAAKSAGMRCVVVPNRVTAGSDFSAADLVVDSLAELPWADLGLG